MAELGPVRPAEVLDWARLNTYLRAALPDLSGTLTVQQFYGGHANLTYLLTYGERELVLRRPPFGRLAPGAHDMGREYRVLAKLHAHYAPAPRAYLYCADAAVIGAPFVVMDRREGVVVRYRVPEVFAGMPAVETRLADALIDALADLHRVDYRAAGLTELGRPEGFVKRQLAGWKKRWTLARTDPDPTSAAILERLEARVPRSSAVAILHNDFKLDNCQFAPAAPDRVAAVFDWDMATLGDPLMDLGTTLTYWPDPRTAVPGSPLAMAGNWPGADHLIARYARRTGFALTDLDWYRAFAAWKNGIILQQLYARYQRGESTDARMARMGELSKRLIGLSQALLKLA